MARGFELNDIAAAVINQRDALLLDGPGENRERLGMESFVGGLLSRGEACPFTMVNHDTEVPARRHDPRRHHLGRNMARVGGPCMGDQMMAKEDPVNSRLSATPFFAAKLFAVNLGHKDFPCPLRGLGINRRRVDRGMRSPAATRRLDEPQTIEHYGGTGRQNRAAARAPGIGRIAIGP